MSRLLLALTLAVLATAASAADPAVEAFKGRFPPQERILLAYALADPAASRQFSEDARKEATGALISVWRQRIALASRDYLARPHPTNERAATVQGMVEPGEWAALMVSLKMLADGGITDQAKFKIFVTMIEEANEALREGDKTEAHRVIGMARPKLTEAMREWLASDIGRDSLAAAETAQRRARELAEQEAAERRREQERAEADRAEQARVRAEQEAAGRVRAGQERAAETQEPQVSTRTTAARPAPAARRSQTPPATRRTPAPDALGQARRSAAEGSDASGRTTTEETAAGGRTFDGSSASGSAPAPAVVTVPPVSTGTGATLAPPTERVPTLTVRPPAPQEEGDDLAELGRMKKKVSGGKKWWAGIGGALGGALLGFLLGGPIGAAIGAAVGGGAGFFAGKFLWG